MEFLIKKFEIFHQKIWNFSPKISTNFIFSSYLEKKLRFFFFQNYIEKNDKKFWTKWQLRPKNVISYIFQRLYYLISFLGILSDDALIAMTSLRDLNLADNQLAALPPTLFSSASLQSLESLQLQNNSLTMLTPGLFTGLSQLVMLNLSHNAIASHLLGKGTSINYVDKHRERGLAKCQR